MIVVRYLPAIEDGLWNLKAEEFNYQSSLRVFVTKFVPICVVFFLFHYRQHDIRSEICTSAEGMAFMLLFLQPEVSSNCSGMVWNGKSFHTEIL